ncbi:DUF1585 domain-containing protein [Archangium gephyra]|uniref:DUF1585 domain-containing protein n=1 Tax=Archangium gephyra TaxID=48 RepID=UPI0035D5233F
MYDGVPRGWRKTWAGAACALLLAGCTSNELPKAKVLPPAPAQSQTGPTGSTPACLAPRDPGRITLHQLNRAEYDNTVRDLLGDTNVKDGVELRALLDADPALERCITQHLLVYGLGRGPMNADACTLEDIASNAGERGGRLSDLILSLIRSEAFTHRRGEPGSSDVEGSR